ncbi:Ferrous iron transport periplasmic protein EfeO, contains peptidase-M75 domain and (frequently) cupredoxin-like domain [plant metagenome]|uniref:Ferrous iron transport periplasmic protein EfeO, contains peptidase-M75 domain and (Frequently) cupredoxin-like domain n=2 Tax=plant metagenome TaxID=1297885 RepID=A0A484VAM2_9ZZZZ
MTAPSPAPRGAAPSRALMRIALAVSILLALAALAAFHYASRLASQDAAPTDGVVQVEIHAGRCEPDSLSVPAGRATFRIVNRSERAVEWEILDGVMVVEERENIAPGFTQTLNARLEPGDYDITCGLLSNPRGKLHVTPTAASDAARAARPSLTAFIGALAEYRVYLVMQAATLQRDAQALADAIEANDLARARGLYPAARLAYKRIEPVADMFADLDTRLDARADYFARREDDPDFMGFHRIEHGLYARQSLAGLPGAAQALMTDIAALQQRLRELPVTPERMAGGAARLAQDMATLKVTGEEDRYAHTDLSGLQGNLDGLRKIVDLLRPFVARGNAALAEKLDGDIAAAQAALEAHRAQGGDGHAGFDTLDAPARRVLAERFAMLATDLASAGRSLGLIGAD